VRRINVRIERVVGDLQSVHAVTPATTSQALARAIRDALVVPLPAEQAEAQSLDPDKIVATVERAVRTTFGQAATRP
jgi:hypothetical protein